MAENYNDCLAANLLCTETCFDDLDPVAPDNRTHQSDADKVLIFGNGESDLSIDLPILSDENFSLMLEREALHLPADDYLNRLRSGALNLSVRREAIDWISKAHSHLGFSEISFCLSVNYLDRFLSMYEQLPRHKPWAIQLLAVTCLSVAAKLEEISVPLTIDLQVCDPNVVFDGKTIRKMELIVLTTLNWRVKAYTPCKFLDYFLRKIDSAQFPSLYAISSSIQLILGTIRGIDFLEFRPSEIAAAVAVFVSGQTQALDIIMALPFFTQQAQKERLMKCLELIKDLKPKRALANGSVPQSPNGVLEAARSNYKTDEQMLSLAISPDTKRRRVETTQNPTTTGHTNEESETQPTPNTPSNT